MKKINAQNDTQVIKTIKRNIDRRSYKEIYTSSAKPLTYV